MSRTPLVNVENQVARVEAATGVQVVVALIDKADTYLELPWRAFGLGASLGAFAAVIADAILAGWSTSSALVTAAASLGTGVTLAVATLFFPAFARLFLRELRRNIEVRHFAESLFLRRELFATPGRNAVLLLVSRFERKVEIVADTGLRDRVDRGDWSRVIAAMTPALAQKRFSDAFRDGLDAMEAMLVAKGFMPRAGGANDLPDRPIVERGAGR